MLQLGQSFKIVFRSIVKPFYKENAGLFVFLFIVMFCIVSKVDGAGVMKYHFSLILGMLKSRLFLWLVFFAWLLYLRKCIAFAVALLKKPEYAFLSILNNLGELKRFILFLLVVLILLFPVILYAGCVVVIGFMQHLYLPACEVISYLFLLSLLSPLWLIAILKDPGKMPSRILHNWNIPASYVLFQLRSITETQKIIWIGIKVFTCSILYLVARNNTNSDYDISFPFLFFNFGILSNGILIYRARELEETHLSFYRSLSVSLFRRFLQYACVYLIMLIPECLIICSLSPIHLHPADALFFFIISYCLLLLMNSISFMEDFSMKDYLKLLLLVFCVEIAGLLTIGLGLLSVCFFIGAMLTFLKTYYSFEKRAKG